MNFLIINNGNFWNRNFRIMGLIVPNFGSSRGALDFNSRDEAQIIIDQMPNSIAKDCKIIRDIFN